MVRTQPQTITGSGTSSITRAPTWDSAVAYREGDYVVLSAVVYKCLAPNTNKSPDTNATYWAATTGQEKYFIIAVVATTGGTASTLQFKSKPASTATAISPAMAIPANSTLILPPNLYGWFVSNALGDTLQATAGTGDVSLSVVYGVQLVGP